MVPKLDIAHFFEKKRIPLEYWIIWCHSKWYIFLARDKKKSECS
jgi:hypothetical protein